MEIEAKMIDLASLGHGAAAELFQEQMEKVLDNIINPNTKPEDVREIILRVGIKPDPTRNSAIVGIFCDSKLAKIIPFTTTMFVARDKDGNPFAVEHNAVERTLPFNVSKMTEKEKLG